MHRFYLKITSDQQLDWDDSALTITINPMQNCGNSEESSDSENSDSEDEESEIIFFPTARHFQQKCQMKLNRFLFHLAFFSQSLQMGNIGMSANWNGTTQPFKRVTWNC